MAKYIVSYDLKAPDRNYKDLISYIKTAVAWAHIHESLWFVETGMTASDLLDGLRAHMDSNDSVFVIQEAGVASWINVIADDEYLKRHL